LRVIVVRTPEQANQALEKLKAGYDFSTLAKEKSVDPTADLREAIDIDSMDFLNLVTALHHRTGIEIPEIDYPKLVTLSGMVAYLEAKLKSANAV